ncbi:MAG TPA: YhgE/Pip domain-containing protein [Nakamurella multipartita]|nr:YhgE/Pip domain-containing protein [Nakamurella multipartita]
MIKTVKLAGYEFRRFKGPWPVIGLLFVLLIPTVYAGLYLWSNWDPYGHRDQVPVAVVNLDEPAQVENATISAGDRLVSELGSDPIFAWQFVGQDQAEQGLADGTYYMIVEIPPDFSANLVSGSGATPERADVNLRLNDANGYLTQLLVASAQPQLEAAIDRAALGAYLESVFANLDTIRDGVRAAAGSAGKLAADTGTALTSATDTANAVTAAKQSSTTVVGDLATAKSSSSALVTSSGDAKASSASAVTALGSATSAASTLSSSADSAASSASSLAGSVGPSISAIDAAAPALGQSAANVEAATQDTSSLAAQQTQDVASVNSVIATLKSQNPGVNWSSLDAAMADLGTNTGLLNQSAAQASAQAVSVNSSATTVTNAAYGLSGAGSELTNLATTTATVSTGMSGLLDSVSTAANAASGVDSAVNGIAASATDLDSSIGAAQLAAQSTDDSLTVAETSSSTLVSTMTGINGAASELATGLSEAADRIPTLAPGEQAQTEQVLSSPADMTVLVDNPAVVYGRGMAPTAFSFAIWVFALAVFLLLRPIAAGALLARASSLRIAVAGWLPPLAVGIVGSLLLFGIVWLGLHLDPVNAGAAVGVIALGVACFTALTHLLRTWLGKIGTAIALVLLMVQFTASGGLYPMPTTPTPFQVIEKAMPMTYLIDALRITFTGGLYQRLWIDLGVLAGITVVAVGLTVLVVHRRRTFRLTDLQPILS